MFAIFFPQCSTAELVERGKPSLVLPYYIPFSVCISNLIPLLLKLEMQTDEGLVKCCWEQNCTSRGRASGCYALPVLCFFSDWWRPLTAQSRWWEGREADHLEVIIWSFPDSRHRAKHTFQVLQMQCPFLYWVSFHSLESLNTVSQIFFIYTYQSIIFEAS